MVMRVEPLATLVTRPEDRGGCRRFDKWVGINMSVCSYLAPARN